MNTTRKNQSKIEKQKNIPKKTSAVLLPLTFIAVAGISVFFWWYNRMHAGISTNDASIDATRITISTENTGRIYRMMFEEGDSVDAGDTVALLDNTDLTVQLRKLEYLVRYHNRNKEACLVKLSDAREDFNRTERQFENKITTLEHFNDIRNIFNLAKVQVKIAEEQIATARADVEVLKKKIDDSVLRCVAPCVVARKWMTEGDIVQPGQALYTMYNLSEVWVTANYEETKIRNIHLNDSVAISLDAFPAASLKGYVEKLGVSATSQFSLLPTRNASGNFTKVTQRVPVRIAFCNKESNNVSLLPGLSATVRILAK